MCLMCTAVLLALPLDIFIPCTELFLLHVPQFSYEPQALNISLFIADQTLPSTAPSTFWFQVNWICGYPATNQTSPHLFGGAVLTSFVQKWQGAGDKPAQGCLLCLPRWGWVAGIWHGQVSASHKERVWAVKSELLMDFASCVGSQSMARQIAESEYGKAVSMSSSMCTWVISSSPAPSYTQTHPPIVAWKEKQIRSSKSEKWIKVKTIEQVQQSCTHKPSKSVLLSEFYIQV